MGEKWERFKKFVGAVDDTPSTGGGNLDYPPNTPAANRSFLYLPGSPAKKIADDARLNRHEEDMELGIARGNQRRAAEKRPSNWQEIQDEKMRAVEDKAYQDAKKPFAKGGAVRSRDGKATKGKTKGRMR